MGEFTSGQLPHRLTLVLSPDAYQRLQELSRSEVTRIGLERLLRQDTEISIESESDPLGATIRNALRVYEWLYREVYGKGYALAVVDDEKREVIKLVEFGL